MTSPIELGSLLVAAAKAVARVVAAKTTDWWAKRKARARAAQGEDFVNEVSLARLVAAELQSIATSGRLPASCQSDEFRSWMLRGEHVDYFVQIVIARAGNLPNVGHSAEERLAIAYEELTGETTKLASGGITTVVSMVVGSLQATASGRDALSTALAFHSAAQLERLDAPEATLTAKLQGVKELSRALIKAAKIDWRMPELVVPLSLLVHAPEAGPAGQEAWPTNLREIAQILNDGGCVVLFGAGGIGKTTVLLELCAQCLEASSRIPLYVDAAVWARSGRSLLGYLAAQPAAVANDVTEAALAKLASVGRLVIMLNGWNEISASAKYAARAAAAQLTGSTSVTVAVTSRTSADTPPMPPAKRIEVVGLTWKYQSELVRTALGPGEAAAVLDLLGRDTQLRHAARSPLILRGLIAKAKQGEVAGASVYDLLGAAIDAFEQDDQRRLVLAEAPVEAHQRTYLEEIACMLAAESLVVCQRDDAVRAIRVAVDNLQELLGPMPRPSEVLDVLVSHHLLHLDGQDVRFAHQRFQEYFVATRLLRDCLKETGASPLLGLAVNLDNWKESLLLTAGKLKASTEAAARARLVWAAAAADAGVASDLAGACGLLEDDDPALHRHLVSRIQTLLASPLEEVSQLGIACELASSLPVFGKHLWELIESDDQQARFTVHRLNGDATLSVSQLGAQAAERIARWPSERRVEFVHEIGGNASNYEYLVTLARHEADAAVKGAAISALFWNFPVSSAPIDAWLEAPATVQVALLNEVEYALEDGLAPDEVRARLTILAEDASLEEATRLRVARAFPEVVGPLGVETILRHLSKGERWNDGPLASVVERVAPERLFEVAQGLALGSGPVPDWIPEFLNRASDAAREAVFERALAQLGGPDFKHVHPSAVGELANAEQTRKCVALWLHLAKSQWEAKASANYDRQRQVEYLLTYGPGANLVLAVLEQRRCATYEEVGGLLALVHRAISKKERGLDSQRPWVPTINETARLVTVFGDMARPAELPQDIVRTRLCGIAAEVSPAAFQDFILETCCRNLDEWGQHKERLAKWTRSPATPRPPQGPERDLPLLHSVAKCGPDAIPFLLDLLKHPCSEELVPGALVRIVTAPWGSDSAGGLQGTSADLKEGQRRLSLGRSFRQGDDSMQGITDRIADELARRLDSLVSRYESQRASGDWHKQEAEAAVGRWASLVAELPSEVVRAPIERALASGLMSVFATIDAIRKMIRQGWLPQQTGVVQHLEGLIRDVRFDEPSRYALQHLQELLVAVVPTNRLSRPLHEYLDEWVKTAGLSGVTRDLGSFPTDNAWVALLEIGKRLDKKEVSLRDGELARALVSALDARRMDEFIELVRTGTFFRWCDHVFSVERFGSGISALLANDNRRLDAFVLACNTAASPLGDALVARVLIEVEGQENSAISYFLCALDAGRAEHSHAPAFRALRAMFALKVETGDNTFEVLPRACNDLRSQLYERARTGHRSADACRRLLADVELGRREVGRPDEEPRHPAVADGTDWTQALAAVTE